ncbi:hypothetical protein SASPL_119868 [Salvia splendens]|uniref:F-box associated beta-propeller type 3 domain-containing protein n=1 Tax=Salvia splendens TaxID=180675 RepID=A0A8X8XP42_SALSN|nr:hypothetical protein SASPL_119868 [Salvia splendens]
MDERDGEIIMNAVDWKKRMRERLQEVLGVEGDLSLDKLDKTRDILIALKRLKLNKDEDTISFKCRRGEMDERDGEIIMNAVDWKKRTWERLQEVLGVEGDLSLDKLDKTRDILVALKRLKLNKDEDTISFKVPERFKCPLSKKLMRDPHKHKHKQDPITKFDFSHASSILGSANGLLLKNPKRNPSSDPLYVCNPTTREFLELHAPYLRDLDCYGLGVSKISGQHKVVLLNCRYRSFRLILERGSSWRRVFPPLFDWCYSSVGVFVNGKLYWLITKWKEKIPCICCFDIETEHFSTFVAPVDAKRRDRIKWRLYALGDSLCFCNDEPYDKEIWKSEHVKRRWSKIPFIVDRPYLGLFETSVVGEETAKASCDKECTRGSSLRCKEISGKELNSSSNLSFKILTCPCAMVCKSFLQKCGILESNDMKADVRLISQ